MTHSILKQPSNDDLKPGMTLTVSKVMTEEDNVYFTKLSHDANPLHLSEELARKTRFGGRIIHGMHTASLFSGVLSKLTPWCMYLKQEIEFLAPVRIGDKITVTGVITSIGAKDTIDVVLVGTNQRNETVIRGIARMKKLKEMYKD